jgi:hypothetical protein
MVVYSHPFPGYTTEGVGFRVSPYWPYPIETSLDLPHPCSEPQGGAFFYLVMEKLRLRVRIISTGLSVKMTGGLGVLELWSFGLSENPK